MERFENLCFLETAHSTACPVLTLLVSLYACRGGDDHGVAMTGM